MSAVRGTGERQTTSLKPFSALEPLTETRTRSAPAALRSYTCCTVTWAPPPMGTSPTLICRLVTGRSRSAASVISLLCTLYAPILIRYERLSSEDFTQVGIGREKE